MRFYKNKKKTESSSSTEREYFDYIPLIQVDDEHYENGAFFFWLTRQANEKDLSDEYDLKHNFGWGGYERSHNLKDSLLTHVLSIRAKILDKISTLSYNEFLDYVCTFKNDDSMDWRVVYA